jgi:uncharacterized protein with FMN-binding domain
MIARRVVPVALAAAGAIALLANIRERPHVTRLSDAARRPAVKPTTRDLHGVSRKRATRSGARRTGTAQATTPFSYMKVRVTLTGGELTAVETVSLTSDGPRTQAINTRAEPILRAEALRAGSAEIDVVSGATYTSESYRDSLQRAIDQARG